MNNDIVATRTGAIGAGSLAMMAITKLMALPSWFQLVAILAATLASIYAMRLSSINTKKTKMEIKILKAKAKNLGVNLDEE